MSERIGCMERNSHKPYPKRIAIWRVVFLCGIGWGFASPTDAASLHENMILVPAGRYTPFFIGSSKGSVDDRIVSVPSFWMDVYSVSNAQYKKFLSRYPEWSKSNILSIYADDKYLSKWSGDNSFPAGVDDQPVTGVSWFASMAYCKSMGKSLPTNDQWEYALLDGNTDARSLNQSVLAWYSSPGNKVLPNVSGTVRNHYGICGLSGVIWEWTLDFNSTMTAGEQRNNQNSDRGLFCGGGSLGVRDATDYATFMRYAMRSSLKGNFTGENLGFRCVVEP